MWEGFVLIPVGASLLAKNSQAPRLFRRAALSLTFFASKLAPTSGPGVQGSTWLHCLLRRLSEIGTLVPNC
ncbi:hypothetical protein C7A12_14295 [Pseudomonas fluorescens]|nr:hypothetical protein C7A12_14295 [Pseudomonas fluorescens]PRW78300.1 hypothetical protein C7A13_13905 [Pseudomonas fluorescens]